MKLFHFMHRAYIQPNKLRLANPASRLELPEEVCHRLQRVLRLKDGEEVELFDGAGLCIRGTLQAQVLFVGQVEHHPQPLRKLTLVQALIALDKLEEVIQRATELAVDEIILVRLERSQIHFESKLRSKLERLQRIAQDASRQSGRAFVPEVLSIPNLIQVLSHKADLNLVADPSSLTTIQSVLGKKLLESERVRIFVGPEGGFSKAEIQLFEEQAFERVKIAPFILRTETAGIAMLAQIAAALLK
ncbi:MAG: 16S rRNA (uracil(1498)-N(3))-methyltransferase [Myxococcaceae bacterium]|nr:16S rRNA (uracil(1498)-N(3))-methyltransferase [Myxococcaceae bacterium]MBH2006142.1 16S rRNA (uracil(1498)-N(3))-methyltransferase [Myxococcaceae bacterium]